MRPLAVRPRAKLAAARIGPMVCELDGPTPILYRSKRLVVTDEIVARDREQGSGIRDRGSGVRGQRAKDVQLMGPTTAPCSHPCRTATMVRMHVLSAAEMQACDRATTE